MGEEYHWMPEEWEKFIQNGWSWNGESGHMKNVTQDQPEINPNPNPNLTIVPCVVYNQKGTRFFEKDMPVCECVKIMKSLYDHVEQIGESSFRVW